MLIGLICVYNIVIKQQKSYMSPLGLIGFFIPATKFNIAFWFVVILLAFMGFLYYAKRIFNKKLFWTMTVIVIIGFIIGAFNPYITNTIIKHNPVYPWQEKIRLT